MEKELRKVEGEGKGPSKSKHHHLIRMIEEKWKVGKAAGDDLTHLLEQYLLEERRKKV